jgi:hypothetical protein
MRKKKRKERKAMSPLPEPKGGEYPSTYFVEDRSNQEDENNQLTFRTGLPFLRKWTQVPDDYEALCQQALQEMQQPDFVATLDIQAA